MRRISKIIIAAGWRAQGDLHAGLCPRFPVVY